jgi:hypothetical protein
MDTQEILDELLALLGQSDAIIRTEALGGGGGGLCELKDKTVFFADTESTTSETARNCAQAVAKMVDIEEIYIKPEIRRFIEDQKAKLT